MKSYSIFVLCEQHASFLFSVVVLKGFLSFHRILQSITFFLGDYLTSPGDDDLRIILYA